MCLRPEIVSCGPGLDCSCFRTRTSLTLRLQTELVEWTPDMDRLLPASRLPDEAVVEAAVGHRTVGPVLHRGHQLGRNRARDTENSRIFNRNKMLSFFSLDVVKQEASKLDSVQIQLLF